MLHSLFFYFNETLNVDWALLAGVACVDWGLSAGVAYVAWGLSAGIACSLYSWLNVVTLIDSVYVVHHTAVYVATVTWLHLPSVNIEGHSLTHVKQYLNEMSRCTCLWSPLRLMWALVGKDAANNAVVEVRGGQAQVLVNRQWMSDICK